MSNSTIRGGAYYRASTIGQEESIPAQMSWAKEAAERHGLRLVAEFDDPGLPGGQIEQRPGLQALLEYCAREFRAGSPIECILVWDPDRLSRASSIKTAAVLSALQDSGVSRLLTASDGFIDLDDVTHRVLYLLKQDLARNGFCEGLARNVLRGMAQAGARGTWLGGSAPFGYLLNAGHLEPHPEHASIVAWLFTAYASGAHTIAGLQLLLRQRGILSPRSGKASWSGATLTRLLRNETYLGRFVWNQTHRGRYARLEGGTPVKDGSARDREQQRRRSGRKKSSLISNDAEHVLRVPNTHPPLVDEEAFLAVQRRLASNRRWTAPHRGGGDWLLSGLVRCGSCGARMHGHTITARNKSKYRYYICTASLGSARTCRAGKSIPQDDLLNQVIAEVQARFADGPPLEALRADIARLADQGAESLIAERDRLRTRLLELDAKIRHGNSNLALLPPDMIPGVIAEVRRWQEEHEQDSRRLTNLETASEARQEMAERIETALRELANLHETIRDATPAEVRAGLADVVSRVTVHLKPAETVRDMEIESIEVEVNPLLVELFTTVCRPQRKTR